MFDPGLRNPFSLLVVTLYFCSLHLEQKPAVSITVCSSSQFSPLLMSGGSPYQSDLIVGSGVKSSPLQEAAETPLLLFSLWFNLHRLLWRNPKNASKYSQFSEVIHKICFLNCTWRHKDACCIFPSVLLGVLGAVVGGVPSVRRLASSHIALLMLDRYWPEIWGFLGFNAGFFSKEKEKSSSDLAENVPLNSETSKRFWF